MAKLNFTDAYLAKLSADKRATLEKVRKAIRAAAPDAEEGVSYGLPAFILGKPIAGFGAGANHCAYYPMSGAVIESMSGDLKGYETSKGAIRFPIDRPLPATLIRKMVKARLAEINGGATANVAPKAGAKGEPAVVAFLRALDHPMKKDIEVVRRIILDVSPDIGEGIKWKAPSFRMADDFATINLRAMDRVELIFHAGARPKVVKQMKLDAPADVVKWLAKDRCMVTVGAGKAIAARRAMLQELVRTWIKQL